MISSAGAITATGQSYVTSSINAEEYRQRAIENALRNVINDKSLHLNSFSIVENGQVLLDQIQSSSKASILSYEVINEYIKDNIYYVNIEAILDDDTTSIEKEVCRNSQVSEVDFNIDISVNLVKFPAWFLLNNYLIENEIKKQHFSHQLNFIQEKIFSDNSKNGYTLFDPEEKTGSENNPYELGIETTFNFLKQNHILIKNEDLEVQTKSTIFRFGKPVSSKTEKKKFRVGQKFGVNFALNSSKEIWTKSKKDLLEALHKTVQSRLDELKCIVIEPELKAQGSTNFISFGAKDGIRSDDIFVVVNNNPQKIYFKVVRVSDYRTELALISKSQKSMNLIGQTLKLIEGL